jgi:hypothetical protein
MTPASLLGVKEVEQEVATHPEQYGISEPLSQQLVHSIYMKYTNNSPEDGEITEG